MGFERGEEGSKKVRLEHRQYRQAKEEQQLEVKKVLDVASSRVYQKVTKIGTLEQTNQILNETINISHQKSKILENKIERLEQEIIEREQTYKRERQELKDSGTATQPDYQAIKKSYDEMVELLKTQIYQEKKKAKNEGFNEYDTRLKNGNTGLLKKTALKSLELPTQNEFKFRINQDSPNMELNENIQNIIELKQKIEEKYIIKEIIKEVVIEKPVIKNIEMYTKLNNDFINLNQRNSELKIENNTLKNEIKDLTQENKELKTENTVLKTAMERFLEHSAVKCIISLKKSFVECFSDVSERFVASFVKQEQENKELKTENQQLNEKKQRGLTVGDTAKRGKAA